MKSSSVCFTLDYEKDWGGRVNSIYAIEYITDTILEIFDKNTAKATFFISTEIAKKIQAQIQTIIKAGHEIASHGHEHNIKYDELSREALNYQIATSKSILQDLTGQNILGFRTPQFRKNEYTQELLAANEYAYDSSSVSVSLASRYKARQFCNGLLPSFPVSSIYGKFPAGLKWINIFGASFNKDEPIIIYSHPFDFLPMKTILSLYDKNIIQPFVLAFYLARIGSPISTLRTVSKASQTIRSILAPL